MTKMAPCFSIYYLNSLIKVQLIWMHQLYMVL